jgi:uncharacterized membrane protein (DUF485 family)
MAKQTGAAGVDWSKIAKMTEFQNLLRSKKSFIVSSVIFFMVFYFTLPVLTSYFTVLNEKAIGSLNWAYLFAFAQFFMTWVLCLIYVKRAGAFDAQVKQVIKAAGGKEEQAA